MEAYQKRVVEEKAQLDERLGKLGTFLEGETFRKLSARDKYLLERQKEVMQSYSEVLGARIAGFNGESQV